MSILKKTNYHHTLQAYPSAIWTHVWENKPLRKILIVDPGYSTVDQISALVDWRGYEVHLLISRMELDACGRATQLKHALQAKLHMHQNQLRAALTMRNQATAAQACEVFLPRADYVYTDLKGNLMGWIDWSYVWEDDQVKLTWMPSGT